MMTILVLVSCVPFVFLDFLSVFLPLLWFLFFFLFPCLWFCRSRDSSDGCWLLLGFSCFCSFVPLLRSPYAAQFSFVSPSVSFLFSLYSLFFSSVPLFFLFFFLFCPHLYSLFFCFYRPETALCW